MRPLLWVLAGLLWVAILILDILWWARVPFGLLVAEVVMLIVTVAFQLWAEHKLDAGRITRRQIEDAPMWTIFRGEAVDPGPIKWEIFEPGPADPWPEDVLAKMELLSVWVEEPEIEDDWAAGGSWRRFRFHRPDDGDAALAYLNKGGVLCKVPDTMNSKYWRLLVVRDKEKDVRLGLA